MHVASEIGVNVWTYKLMVLIYIMFVAWLTLTWIIWLEMSIQQTRVTYRHVRSLDRRRRLEMTVGRDSPLPLRLPSLPSLPFLTPVPHLFLTPFLPFPLPFCLSLPPFLTSKWRQKVFCAGFGARCAGVHKFAVFSLNVPLSIYCKIRYVYRNSKFTAARGSPCDSTASLYCNLYFGCVLQQ